MKNLFLIIIAFQLISFTGCQFQNSLLDNLNNNDYETEIEPEIPIVVSHDARKRINSTNIVRISITFNIPMKSDGWHIRVKEYKTSGAGTVDKTMDISHSSEGEITQWDSDSKILTFLFNFENDSHKADLFLNDFKSLSDEILLNEISIDQHFIHFPDFSSMPTYTP